MFQKTKEKLKKFKRWIIGIFIGTAMAAAPLVMPPEDTTYRVEWKEAFNYISCLNDYICNKNIFLENAAKHPDYYKTAQEIVGAEGAYTYLLWTEYSASTTEQAIDKINLNERQIAKLKAKTIYETWYEKYDFGKIEK